MIKKIIAITKEKGIEYKIINYDKVVENKGSYILTHNTCESKIMKYNILIPNTNLKEEIFPLLFSIYCLEKDIDKAKGILKDIIFEKYKIITDEYNKLKKSIEGV